MRSQLEIQPESFNYFLFPRSDREALEMEQFEFLESEINRNNPDFIRWVQRSLNKILGLRLKDDGIIGAQTRSAIRTFQQQKGLVADGIVGPNTEASIKEMLRSIGIAPQTKPPGTTPSILTTPADQSIQRTIYGWGRYLKRVEELPADQQAILKGIGDVINVSYKPGGQPIRIVRVYGHADWDTPRNLQREKQMSDERARMVTDWLRKYVGRTIVSQITWDTQGFGATKLKVQPTTEVNRKQNRRVEINLLRGVGQIQSTPVFFTIEQPNATNYVRMHDLFVYMATYQRDSSALLSVQIFKFNQGKLADVNTNRIVPIDCDKDVSFYFSHRNDLIDPATQADRFRKDKRDLPMIGPIRMPRGNNPEIHVNIWEQKDWIIIRNVDVGQGRFDAVKMADWHGRYTIGWWGIRPDNGKRIFSIYQNSTYKDQQETWKSINSASGGGPIPLLHWGNPGNIPMFIGTLSDPSRPKVKILLVKNGINVASYNEINKGSNNIERNGYHQYDRALVYRLVAAGLESPGPDKNALIDALPNPPERFLLPGDICWNDQGQTNNCGAFSFAAAMNYWYPYINNPAGRDGSWFNKHVPSLINGARTPSNLEDAAERFLMYGKDRDAEKLDRARAIKLIKLWLTAGIPILFLSKESSAASWWPRLWSYHWKTLVGYDGNAIFLNNSGGNQEGENPTLRDPGFDYEHAPVGNNSNSENNFWTKWKAGGGDIVDLFTSVDECTYIPIYPKNINFRGSSPK